MKRLPLLLGLALLTILTAPAAFASGGNFFAFIPGVGAGEGAVPPLNITGISHGLVHVVVMGIVAVLIILIALALRPRMAADGDVTPPERFGLQGFSELLMETLMGLMKEIIGHEYKRFVPLIGTLAFFILFGNVLGLIPGLASSNDNLNMTAAMAILVFFAYNAAGVKAHGFFGWLAHFMGPLEGKLKYGMAPLMVPIEMVSHLARPLSLALRLFGNMAGDHMVLGVFVGLVAIPLLYPLPIMALGLIVCIVQTLVFCLLTMVYIGQAVAHEEH
jgi:F-type H+-transporting ATPase subunit a